MKLGLSGDARASRIETGAPYALFGDKDGDLTDGLALGPGSYRFEVDVFSGPKGSGTRLDSFDDDFTAESAARICRQNLPPKNLPPTSCSSERPLRKTVFEWRSPFSR